MTKIKEISSCLESIAPLAFQEDYDNSGLIVGNPETEVTGILVCLDSTEDVLDEAMNENCNLVVAHHPIIFRGLKKLTGKNYIERTIIKAIKNKIGIYAIHTNLDNVISGVNRKICDKLELEDVRILTPKQHLLGKLVTFIPKENTEEVLAELHNAGAGDLGEYDNCSFIVEGTGRFKPGDSANPHIGEIGALESVQENRIEVIFPAHRWQAIYSALQKSHPYEEVAYYHTLLNNTESQIGSGMLGTLNHGMAPLEFLQFLKEKMSLSVIRHSKILEREIKRIAVCGGSGSFLIQDAIANNADVFVTADIKYHQFFDGEDQIILTDIGHYESEVFTKELIGDLLTKNFNTFAVNLSKTVTNPIQYY